MHAWRENPEHALDITPFKLQAINLPGQDAPTATSLFFSKKNSKFEIISYLCRDVQQSTLY